MEKKKFKLIMQNILHHLDDGIHVIDKGGKTIIYNEAMAKLEGIEREKILGNPLLNIFPSLDEDSSTLLTVMKTGRPLINKVQTYLNYKGEKITTINTTVPLFEDDIKYGALEIARDITDIKELSEQLVDLQQELLSEDDNNSEDSKKKKYTFKNIIGNSKEIKRALDIAKKASNTPSSVLIYGETGTGKELFAQSIHYCGFRKNKPFVAQNCAALPETLLEGILFGTVKGGFTGAIDRPGLFEQANKGTLLLDEINSMGLTLQSKLLRVLQEGYIRRVGDTKEIPVDVRIIATTNESPREAIKNGSLRKDLFYRLSVINVDIPSLKERQEDISLLCDYFINKYNKMLNKNITEVSQRVSKLFKTYDWPGNVREFQNVIEGAMNYVKKEDNIIKTEHIPYYIKDYKANTNDKIIERVDLNNSLPEILTNIEKRIILSKLKSENFNISKAARELKVKRQTLQHKIKKYDLK
ncbi:MAG: PAS domain S-box protein [Firmicutes bacterium]|nr:PAS domain S-box protein [Bacillota bacterium]